MNKENIKEALKKLKESSKKRNFNQSIDLIINLRGINIKKNEEQVDLFVTLHYPKGKITKICGIVGPELKDNAKEACDLVITAADFGKYEGNKKELKKLANNYDFFVAQANVMPKIAQIFGKVFGPKQKMPNPKAGCVVPPNANMAALVEKLQKTVRVKAKTQLGIQCIIGNEAQNEDEVIDNIITTYNAIIHHLPHEESNIREVLIKLCMSKPIAIKLK
ncbi:50S ribosomal protein L1 [Candidatus Woesearchaeota archaeon]|jgi:large subunit ribosomal protein L1|nr:50S ribosomal protein L1 [Candidatus Woesearchaeota archaeon]MBT6518265.1 50S ribosomal protein L1 [Candidatus Woesearchaeota archaeon]MBT7367564.1 50S ribosomal protein L1 [Candidatus Woesearchaeota archaeon]